MNARGKAAGAGLLALALLLFLALRGEERDRASEASVGAAQDSDRGGRSGARRESSAPSAEGGTALIRGKVLSEDGPVEGAVLSLLRLGSDRPSTWSLGLRTARDGSFAIETEPGRVRILAEAEGFALAESRELVLGPGERREITIHVAGRGSLLVTVRDPEGRGLRARLVPMGHPSWRLGEVVTDEAGSALLEKLPLGPIRFRVSAPGFQQLESKEVQITAGEQAELALRLERAEGIQVRVYDPAGQPIRGAAVTLRGAGSENEQVLLSDEQGTGRFEPAAPGWVELLATHPAFGPSQLERVPANEVRVVELRLSSGGAISGRVLDFQGAPLGSRFSIAVEDHVPEAVGGIEPQSGHFPSRSFMSPQGRFRLAPLAPGKYDLFVDAYEQGPGRAHGVIVTQGGETQVEIRLEPPSGLDVTVVDRTSRTPVEAAKISIWDAFRRSRGLAEVWASTDAEGFFHFEGITPGRRSFSVSKEGYIRRVVAGVQVPSRGTAEITVELVPVQDPSAKSTEFVGIGAVLSMNDAGELAVDKLMSDAPAERFGLLPGDHILRVDGEDVSRLGLGATVDLIRGEEGSAVVLEIVRPPNPYPFQISIDRGRVVYQEQP